jgi:hypothetical protein
MSTVLERRVREHLTEPRPVPEPMTDTEILDWLNEYCDGYEFMSASVAGPSIFNVFFFDGSASGDSLRVAVCNAAAIWKEMNK